MEKIKQLHAVSKSTHGSSQQYSETYTGAEYNPRAVQYIHSTAGEISDHVAEVITEEVDEGRKMSEEKPLVVKLLSWCSSIPARSSSQGIQGWSHHLVGEGVPLVCQGLLWEAG